MGLGSWVLGLCTPITYYQLPISYYRLILRMHPSSITDFSVIVYLNPLQITRMREYADVMTLSHLTGKLPDLA